MYEDEPSEKKCWKHYLPINILWGNARHLTGGEGEPDVKLTGVDSTINVACRRIEQNVWEAAYTPARSSTEIP